MFVLLLLSLLRLSVTMYTELPESGQIDLYTANRCFQDFLNNTGTDCSKLDEDKMKDVSLWFIVFFSILDNHSLYGMFFF
jgi:hypothetical protein